MWDNGAEKDAKGHAFSVRNAADSYLPDTLLQLECG